MTDAELMDGDAGGAAALVDTVPRVAVVLGWREPATPVGPAEDRYIAGLEALSRGDSEGAARCFEHTGALDSSGALAGARLLRHVLSDGATGLDPVDTEGEISVRGLDEVAQTVASAVLTVAPVPSIGLTLVSSGFLAAPSLVERLLGLRSTCSDEDWAAAGVALADLDDALTRASADRAPSVAYEMIPESGGVLGAQSAEFLALRLLAERGRWTGPHTTRALAAPIPVNTFLHLLVAALTPAEVDLVLIDLKRGELTRWEGDAHLAAPVAETPEEAIRQLRGLVKCMEERYVWLRKNGAKDIHELNLMLADAGYHGWPRVVCAIDGLLDLASVNKKCEDLLVGLANDGAAVGVHIVFTQRAPCDLITLPPAAAAQPDVTLDGLAKLMGVVRGATGDHNKSLALARDIEARYDSARAELKKLKGATALRRPVAMALSLAMARSSFHVAKAQALSAKGLTDAALLVWDDAIRLATSDEAPIRWRWAAWARYCKSRLLVQAGNLAAARRELARLYADFPDYEDDDGLLDKLNASPSENRREPIPEAVRNEVWRRDEGRCVQCGSPEKLEFDHIIPVSRGGANTARNLQLLCEPCNRRKGARI